jgi:DNA polymerase III subunit delta'
VPLRDVTGHRSLLTLLSRAIERSSLPQSLIFSGPDGVGKRLAAIGLAQTINCLNRVKGDATDTDADVDAAAGGAFPVDACGVCAACRRIAQGNHPDIILTGIGANLNDIRGLIEMAAYRPFEGKHRVFILDDADRLSSEIQNALLKTLEEPPPSSSFVLVTSRPELLLITVRSRCPMLRFGRLPAAEVEGLLIDKHGLDAQRAHEAALAGEGSVGRALLEASDEGAATRDLVEQALQVVHNARGPADKLRAAGMLLEPGETKSRPRGKGGRIVSKAQGERDLLGLRLAALNAALRDLAAVGTGARQDTLSSAPSHALQTLVKGFGPQRLLTAFDAVGQAQQALDRNVSPKTVADWLAFQL